MKTAGVVMKLAILLALFAFPGIAAGEEPAA